MKQLFKKWGSICLILGSILMATGNSLSIFELVAETVLMHSMVLWGHGLLAFGFIGLAVSIMDKDNRIKVMGGALLSVFASVVLGSLIGSMILQSAGELSSSIDTLAAGNALLNANMFTAHFGYVIGVLILLTTALGSSVYSNSSLYIFIVSTLLIGAGPFTSDLVFGIGFVLSLVGGVWVGKQLLNNATSSAPAPEIA